MRAIAELGLPVISDEIYLDLSYDAAPLSYLRFSGECLDPSWPFKILRDDRLANGILDSTRRMDADGDPDAPKPDDFSEYLDAGGSTGCAAG